MNGLARDDLLTDSDILYWDDTTNDIFSDHAPILYIYLINVKSNIECFYLSQHSISSIPKGSSNISFITWNIAYKMKLTSRGYYTSKFYCSNPNPDKDHKICVEEKKVYEKRLTNILTQVDDTMNSETMKDMNYVFLQECTPTLLEIVKDVAGFDDRYKILYKDKDKYISEFCLIVRKKDFPADDDIIFFDFNDNTGDTPMSKYISSQFYSYDIEVNTDVNTDDLKRVMCYIVKSRSTIFFNVHFAFGTTLIFHRQIQLYNFMNAIVYSIRSIPSDNIELYPYQNYDIVFTGDFNLNMLQRFPKDIKRFGYPGNNNMIPIFFTCNYIKEQKTIISTTERNASSARATNENHHNYNLTNIDFSILYPRIGNAGTTPIEVEIQTPMPTKKILPTGSGSSAPVSPPPSSADSTIPLYIRESDKLLAASPSIPECECGHMLCKRYTILKNNNKVKDSEGVHSVMIFESADDSTPTNRKFRILLGKEKKDGFYCMNTIGGKANHETLRATKCKICIIQNLIDEINEEAKLKFPNGDASINATSFKGNMDLKVFDSIFKKPGATGTDYTDYYLYARGGYGLNKKSNLFDFSFVFYGLYPYVFKESELCNMVTDTNLYIQSALKGASTPDLKEMKYINLIRYNYDVLKDNPQYYSSINKLSDNNGKPFTPPVVGDYLIPPSRFKNDTTYDYKPFFIDGKGGLFGYTKLGEDTDYVSLYARYSIYSSEKFNNAQKIIDEVVNSAKKNPRPLLAQKYKSSDFSFGQSDSTRYTYYCAGIPASGTPAPASSSGGSKRFTLRNNNNNNNNNNSKSTSRKIKKHASMPTTKFSKKKRHSMHKHKTRRHKH